MSDKYDMELTRALKNSQQPVSTESTTDKMLRETQLVGAGFMGIGKAASDSIKPENLPETGALLAISGGLGYGLGRMTAAPGAIGVVGKVAATGLAPAFLWDLGVNGQQAWNAMGEAWDSNRNWNNNVAAMEKSVGKFAFDSIAMGAVGIGGHSLARSSMAKTAAAEMAGIKPIEALKPVETAGIEGGAEKFVVRKVVPENTISMRELAQRNDPMYQKLLDDYYPQLERAFPDKSEIELKATYDAYLKDPNGTWDMLILRDADNNIVGGIQSQVINVDGKVVKNATWAEHIWLSPEARSYPNFRTLLRTAQDSFQKSGSDFVFMEFNDRAKMTWKEMMVDAEGGLPTEDREKIWARVGLNILTDRGGRPAPYSQPGMDGQDPVTYLTLGMADTGGKPLSGRTIPTEDYKTLLQKAHATIVDINVDPTVRAYTSRLDEMIASGDSELTFNRIADTVVERLVNQRFINKSKTMAVPDKPQ